MPHLDATLTGLLEAGIRDRLFSAAAVAAVTPAATVPTIARGTVSFDSETSIDERTLFDLASVSKTFVAAAVLGLVADGSLSLDEPVAPVLSVGSGPASERITMRHLLTHTSGLPADCFAWRDRGLAPAQVLDEVLSMRLVTQPGEEFRYSCLGYIAAGRIAELVSGLRLDRLVAERIAGPLGAESLGYSPAPDAVVVATEVQDYLGRGLVHGGVHDELAWALGRPVGNAGTFGTAGDVLAFATMVLRDGLGPHGRVLDAGVAALLVEPVIAPGRGSEYGHTHGLRYADPAFMGSVRGFGHTGFTGTMFVIDRQRGTAVVLLTNRVHPHRDRVDLSAFRRAVTEAVAVSVGDARPTRD